MVPARDRWLFSVTTYGEDVECWEKIQVHAVNAYITSLWIVQIPVSKNTAKSRDKTSASSAEREKAIIIPHIVVNVDGEEHLKVDDLLKNTSLPALHQVQLGWFNPDIWF